METVVKRSVIAVVQWAALGLAVVSAVWALAWILGPNGFNRVELWRFGRLFMWSDPNAVPYEPVSVSGDAGEQTAIAANAITGGLYDTGNGTAGSEFMGNGANMGLWTISDAERFLWMGVRALPLIGVAVIWWLVFRTLGEIRKGLGFDDKVARRIVTIGALVAVGSPLAEYARWAVADWLVSTSSAASIATALPLNLNLSVVALGLVIIAIGIAWREAASMRHDLQGLV